MSEIKTIRIDHEGFPDGMLINEPDFDPQQHTKFGEAAEAEPKALVDMTIAQMRAYAKEHSITIGADATTKDAVLAVIQAAEAKA
ncbi:hypothetical protein [Solidesulfovibrio alcoholivorans]|uniref:hypothetical protein n=1 Tax=Solidesulfovibrio alcoholivorans TaxID=81406 RepID=UPI00049829A3|nr:hypothetical protein [Solidesulfovibrio alcoholivorans]